MVKEGKNHVVFVVDGEANLITSIVNGKLCDGGRYRFQGWSWFSSDISLLNGNGYFRIASSFDGSVKKLRVYERRLTTSEAINNYRSEVIDE